MKRQLSQLQRLLVAGIDIWIAKWGNSGYIESVGGCISLVFLWDLIDYNGNVRN